MTSDDTSKPVTIVGAGIVGICCALSLLERGYRVTLIDRDPPASGASHGNAGVVSPWTCTPQSMPGVASSVPGWLLDPNGPVVMRWSYLPRLLPWVLKFIQAGRADRLPAIADAMNALNRPNADLYRQHLSGTGGEFLLADSWYVHVFRRAEQASLDGLAWRMRAERGVPLEVVTGEALREIEPALAPEYQGAILIKDQARARDPGAVGRTLFEKAQAMGAQYHQRQVDAVTPRAGGSWSVMAQGEEFQSPVVVIAAGAWSGRLLEPLGFKVPLEAERGYHLVLKNPGITLNNSIMDTERKFVASSMNAGVRCAGTAEFAGLDAAPDMRRADIFKRLSKALFPDINTDECEAWSGIRPSMPDSLPCLGPVPGRPGLFAAFGHSHYGFGMAPQTGRLVAATVDGQTPNVSMDPYRVDRF